MKWKRGLTTHLAVQMSVLLYSQNNKQSEMRFRAAKSLQFMQKIFGLSMVFFVIVLYFIWLLTGKLLYVHHNYADKIEILAINYYCLDQYFWNLYQKHFYCFEYIIVFRKLYSRCVILNEKNDMKKPICWTLFLPHTSLPYLSLLGSDTYISQKKIYSFYVFVSSIMLFCLWF